MSRKPRQSLWVLFSLLILSIRANSKQLTRSNYSKINLARWRSSLLTAFRSTSRCPKLSWLDSNAPMKKVLATLWPSQTLLASSVLHLIWLSPLRTRVAELKWAVLIWSYPPQLSLRPINRHKRHNDSSMKDQIHLETNSMEPLLSFFLTKLPSTGSKRLRRRPNPKQSLYLPVLTLQSTQLLHLLRL